MTMGAAMMLCGMAALYMEKIRYEPKRNWRDSPQTAP